MNLTSVLRTMNDLITADSPRPNSHGQKLSLYRFFTLIRIEQLSWRSPLFAHWVFFCFILTYEIFSELFLKKGHEVNIYR